MSRYNYFDDEPEHQDSKINFKNFDIKKLNLRQLNLKELDFGKLKDNAINAFDDLVHGDSLKGIREIRTMPNLSTLLLKLTAFVLFIIIIITFILGFSHTISSQNKKNARFCADAGKVCTDYLTDFGTAKWERLDSKTYGDDMARLMGLCYARQMDFNSDGDDELMLCYNNRNVYTLEVWGYVDKQFTKLYSEEANKTKNAKDGCWIAFYYNNNRYYICRTTPDKPNVVKMYALKGDKFKAVSTCDYDYKNNIYSVKGKINAEDFETIKLSVIKTSKAERIIDTVTENIDSFNTVSLVAINSQKGETELKADAYYKIIEGRNEKYGKASIEKDDGKSYIDGLAIAQLVDFNGDDNEELLLVYRKMVKQSATNYYTGERIIIEEPTYCMEVYSWNGTVAKKIFSKDSISNYLFDDSVNYVILKNNSKSIDICTNTCTYTDEYNYSASSRIFKYKDEKFENTFSARQDVSYGYKNYYLDGEYSYRSSFEENAFKVPKFLDDDAEYDKSKYSLIYLSGRGTNELQSTVDKTVKTIEGLNRNYSAED